ncbi:biopolymer transporter ExbD [Aestuariicella sp. G3-2]|nr:biopolymer transporter ExbD [Aestuariicella albida]
MLDVVFIMLIFFIVTASFVKESTIDVNMPDPNENQQQTDDDNAAIVVTVKANDEIWMDDRRIDIRAVRANIERVHAEKPQAPVVVKADANSTAKVFVAVADAAREAKVYNVSLLPPEEKK